MKSPTREPLATESRLELPFANWSEQTAVRVSPSGSVELLGTSVPTSLSDAFRAGLGTGLVELGARYPDARLSEEVAYFRELGRAFVARACAIPNIESNLENPVVEPPEELFGTLLASVPPVTGAEYFGATALESAWASMTTALRSILETHSLERFLSTRSPTWNVVGRVCLHLAENRKNPDRPFAFLATYAHDSSSGRAQHLPLKDALDRYARSKADLLRLLSPISKAAERSSLIRELTETGEIYHPLAWTPEEAHRFLLEVPSLESCGVVVRVPDWWRRRGARPAVGVRIGEASGKVGFAEMLSFKAELSIDGEPLSAAETEALLKSTHELVLLRGRWVEVDHEKLASVLDHWRRLESERPDGLSFLDGMRLLAGAGDAAESAEVAEWTRVISGGSLKAALERLERPGSTELPQHAGLRAVLRPYQQAGLSWLLTLDELGLGGCLADDMGLGKTIQVISLMLAKKLRGPSRSLLVVPASLLGNWSAELARFAPSLSVRIAHASSSDREESAEADVTITSYGTLRRLPKLLETSWDLVALDEAQAIKSSGALQTQTAKKLKAKTRLALTGTPVENRLSDLWSIFDFLQPGLLGTERELASLMKRSSGLEGFKVVRKLVRPYILRRMKTDRSIIDDLPDKTEMSAECGLSREQAALYSSSVEELVERLRSASGIQRRGLVLAFLMRFKQICNHPAQWLDDGRYSIERSGKFGRLKDLCEEIASKQEKVLVFTQFRSIIPALSELLEPVFGRPGLSLSGETRVKVRKELVDAFQDERGAPFFVLSLKAGGTGLNLTAASHVIHFDRWWNPAVENQATDRAFRIGQKRNVLVHKLRTRGTIEDRIDDLIRSKRELAETILEPSDEVKLTELSDAELLKLVSLDLSAVVDD
ncbi:MAG: DEAD/DEAH box helicase [Deltaproteobacteria bacterium]|nr:DEAD/DEAH box helicase [Deltaproteobacteria bacterium]